MSKITKFNKECIYCGRENVVKVTIKLTKYSNNYKVSKCIVCKKHQDIKI